MNQQMNLFDMANEAEKYVRRITYREAQPFIESIHYSRKMPNVTDAFGLFVGGEMAGVVTYGIPASHPLCIGLAGEKNQDMVRELNRLAILPKYTGGGYNYASYLVANSLKALPNGTFVVSYADTAWTHVGYVYQACNFLYTGTSAKRVDTYQPDGLHPRAYNKDEHSELYQTRSEKYRYVYLVGDKRTKKRMLQELKYPIVTPYPKGDEKHYDTQNPQRAVPIVIIDRKKASHEQQPTTPPALPTEGVHGE